MTHFKVSDEAAEVALSALRVTELAVFGETKTPANGARREAIKAAIEAALPAMFELVGWQFRLTLDDRFTVWMDSGDTEEMRARKARYVADDAEDRIEFRAVYTIKEPK